jgi:peptidoglycan/xylan/chitin deacetylase (PgdA/CDA1 family)
LKIYPCIALLLFVHIAKTQDSDLENERFPDIPSRFMELSIDFPETCFFAGRTNKKVVALTFDDGPTEVSKQVLILLDQYKAKGTFFWLGEQLDQHQEFALQMAKGHQLASHSWDHANLWEATNEDLWDNQVQKTNLEFERLGLPVPKYYRPPYGAVTKAQVAYLTNKKMNTVLWSLSTLDWDITRNAAEEIVERFKSGLHPGAIVLLHDRGFNDDGEQMLIALNQILTHGITEGYQFVTIEELF